MAEYQLQLREQRCGRVTNRERYLAAIIVRLEREQANHPTNVTARAQAEISARNETQRQPLPPPADEPHKQAGRDWFNSMRATLGKPTTTHQPRTLH